VSNLSVRSEWKLSRDRSEDNVHVAYWHEAEEPMMSKMKGDALTIMDCRFASSGTLHPKGVINRVSTTKDILNTIASGSEAPKNSVRTMPKENGPSYYLLTATREDRNTRAPGPGSLTALLCDALEELVAESYGGPFGLIQISDRINRKGPYDKCHVWDRTQASRSHPQLGRVGRARRGVRGRPFSRIHFADVVQEVMAATPRRKVKHVLRFINIMRSRIGVPAEEKSRPRNRGYRNVEVLIFDWDEHVNDVRGIEDGKQKASRRVQGSQGMVPGNQINAKIHEGAGEQDSIQRVDDKNFGEQRRVKEDANIEKRSDSKPQNHEVRGFLDRKGKEASNADRYL
jgi:hypothetical protein